MELKTPTTPGTLIPPPMLILHKGWLGCWKRQASAKALVRYDRLKARLRGRPWWRGRSARWIRIGALP